jgi:hypothetical protein
MQGSEQVAWIPACAGTSGKWIAYILMMLGGGSDHERDAPKQLS